MNNSEHIEKEKALKREHKFLRNVMATIPDSMLILNRELRIKSANRSFYKLFQTGHAKIIGRDIADILGDKDGKLSAELARLFGTEDTLENFEWHYQSEKLGERILNITVRGMIVEEEEEQQLVVIQDITERRRVEEALRESEEKYRSLVNNISLGIFRSTPGPRGRFLEVNPAMQQITGYSREELLKMDVSDLYQHPEERERVLEEIASTMGMTTRELQLKKKGGTEITVSDTKVAVRNDAGQVMYFDGIMEDITERKQAEEQIRASLKEKEMLLMEIHHRVKNNLQVISSLLNLQSGYTTDQRALELFKEAQERIRAIALVHEKLYRSPDLARIDFGKYVQEIAEDLIRSHATVPGTVTLQIDIDSVDLGIDTAIPLGLIINELVTNSLKHAFPEGSKGEIRIELSAQENKEFLLIVGDNGIGVPQDLDFRNTHSLGMQLVASLVKQLRGTIELDSQRGTEWRIRFTPLA